MSGTTRSFDCTSSPPLGRIASQGSSRSIFKSTTARRFAVVDATAREDCHRRRSSTTIASYARRSSRECDGSCSREIRPMPWSLRAAQNARCACSTKSRRRTLLAAAKIRLSAVVVLAVTTGLRRGEILGLRWEDIDLDRAILQVRRTLEQARGGLRFKEPKTERGRRLVALGPDAVETLRRHRLEQIKERVALGQRYKNSDLVCARLHGTPLDPAEVTAGFAKLIRSLDLPRVRLHDLRHGHATHLLRLGIHPKVVSERLGHSGVGITLNTYSHILPGMQEDAALRLDRALSDARTAK